MRTAKQNINYLPKNVLMIFKEPGMWSDWSAWSTCSTTCGGGFRTRTRECLTESGLEVLCEEGMAIEEEICNDDACDTGTVCLAKFSAQCFLFVQKTDLGCSSLCL